MAKRIRPDLPVGMAGIPLDMSVALGMVKDAFVGDRVGVNTSVGTTTEDVWDYSGGGQRTLLTSAETMNIVSTDVNDTSAGTGARTITIVGLDENYNRITENVTLNGTSNVLTSKSYLRVGRMLVISAGSGLTNAGEITATASSSGEVQDVVPELGGISSQCALTVPADHFMILTLINIGTGRNDEMEISLVANFPQLTLTQVEAITHIMYEGSESLDFQHHQFFPEKTDLVLRARRTAGTSAKVSGGMQGLIFPNSYLGDSFTFY
jgi:hypothetical protein